MEKKMESRLKIWRKKLKVGLKVSSSKRACCHRSLRRTLRAYESKDFSIAIVLSAKKVNLFSTLD